MVRPSQACGKNSLLLTQPNRNLRSTVSRVLARCERTAPFLEVGEEMAMRETRPQPPRRLHTNVVGARQPRPSLLGVMRCRMQSCRQDLRISLGAP